MPTYTDQTTFEAYTALRPVDNDIPGLLDEAEKLVDDALGRYAHDPTTGLKLNPATLEAWVASALSEAVCAQAEYMIVKGPEFFVEQVPLDPSGPDGSQKGREPLLAPKANRALSRAHLYRLAGRSQPPFPNQNWADHVY